jgi:hypothetical protein
LPLVGGTNPAHAVALAVLRERAVKPILGERNELSETDWLALQAKLAPFEEWRSDKTEASVEALGPARVRQILTRGAKAAVTTLIARDQAFDTEVAAIADVHRLLLYNAILYLLCTNFVNFRDFYDAGPAGHLPRRARSTWTSAHAR